jgi:basic membrane protein A and related proteins
MRKMTRAGALAVAGALALSACGDAPDDSEEPTAAEDDGAAEEDDVEEEPADDEGEAEEGGDAEAADFKACMITDAGGVDDASFNETSYNGLLDAESELGIEVQVLESTSETDFEPNMQTFIQQGDCDLIVPVGFLLEEVTVAAAEANPEQNFAIVDVGNPDGLQNVLGLTFNTSEAAFLAGYASAATSETGTLGTYGGINIPTVTIFMDGFLAGANYYAEETGEEIEVIGWDGSDGQFTGNFDNLDDGRRITESLLDNGADTILPVAGPVGGGSAAAIQDRGEGRLIWVDTDGYESTDFGDLMFTSVEKQMDVAVFDAVQGAIDGTFEGGEYVGTLENEGVDISPFHDFEGEVPEDVTSALEEIRQGIIDGEISVDPADYDV